MGSRLFIEPRITLTFQHVVKVESNVKSYLDGRHRVWRATVSYMGSDGQEYWKSFENKHKNIQYPTGVTTHFECANLKKQW
jgi:hypothetical protein